MTIKMAIDNDIVPMPIVCPMEVMLELLHASIENAFRNKCREFGMVVDKDNKVTFAIKDSDSETSNNHV